MKKSIIIISIIVIAIVLFFLLNNTGYSYDSQWCMNCGHVRSITKNCIVGFCKTSEKIIDNYFSEYWEKTHGLCKEHAWRNFHGGSRMTLNSYTYSGYYPVWVFWQIDGSSSPEKEYLELLYSNDATLLKEVLEHMLELEKERIITSKYPASEQNQEFFRNFNDFKNHYFFETDPRKKTDSQKKEEFEKFKTWWQSYKTKYNL